MSVESSPKQPKARKLGLRAFLFALARAGRSVPYPDCRPAPASFACQSLPVLTSVMVAILVRPALPSHRINLIQCDTDWKEWLGPIDRPFNASKCRACGSGTGCPAVLERWLSEPNLAKSTFKAKPCSKLSEIACSHLPSRRERLFPAWQTRTSFANLVRSRRPIRLRHKHHCANRKRPAPRA